jgi:hypothetical protein
MRIAIDNSSRMRITIALGYIIGVRDSSAVGYTVHSTVTQS